jgi:hypothetical protein
MKRLFEFNVSQNVEVDEPVKVKTESGEEVETIKKVVKPIPKKFFLRKPTRELFDEAELFYNVRLAEGIKAGLLTNALLAKRFANDGGVLSENEKENLAVAYLELFELQNKYQRIETTAEDQRTPEEKEELERVKKEMVELRRKIQDFELQQSSLYDHTAENRARNKTIFWWMMNLSFKENDKGEPEPFFGAGDLEERLSVYDGIEDSEDVFLNDVMKRFLYFTSFWYVGRARNQQEFEQLAAGITAKTSEPTP